MPVHSSKLRACGQVSPNLVSYAGLCGKLDKNLEVEGNQRSRGQGVELSSGSFSIPVLLGLPKPGMVKVVLMSRSIAMHARSGSRSS